MFLLFIEKSCFFKFSQCFKKSKSVTNCLEVGNRRTANNDQLPVTTRTVVRIVEDEASAAPAASIDARRHRGSGVQTGPARYPPPHRPPSLRGGSLGKPSLSYALRHLTSLALARVILSGRGAYLSNYICLFFIYMHTFYLFVVFIYNHSSANLCCPLQSAALPPPPGGGQWL